METEREIGIYQTAAYSKGRPHCLGFVNRALYCPSEQEVPGPATIV